MVSGDVVLEEDGNSSNCYNTELVFIAVTEIWYTNIKISVCGSYIVERVWARAYVSMHSYELGIVRSLLLDRLLNFSPIDLTFTPELQALQQ